MNHEMINFIFTPPPKKISLLLLCCFFFEVQKLNYKPMDSTTTAEIEKSPNYKRRNRLAIHSPKKQYNENHHVLTVLPQSLAGLSWNQDQLLVIFLSLRVDI